MPTYLLRPTGTVANALTLTGAATAHEALDEVVTQPTAPSTASDYLSSSTAAQAAHVDLGTFTLPAGETVQRVTLWVYAAAGAKRAAGGEVLSGGAVLGGSATNRVVPASSAAGWRSLEVVTGPLTQTQIDALQLRFTIEATAGGGGAGAVTLYSAYAEVTTGAAALEQRSHRFRADDTQGPNGLFGTLIHTDDFETSTLWSGAEAGDTVERSSAWSANGTYSLRHAGTRAGTEPLIYRPNTITGIVAGRTYVFRARIKSVAGNGGRFAATWRDAAFAWIGNVLGNTIAVGNEGTSEASGVAIANTTGYGLELHGDGNLTGAFDHSLDAIEVYEGRGVVDPAVGAGVNSTVGDVIRIRIEVQETGGVALTTGFKLRYSKNGGAYTDVGAATELRYADSPNVTNGDATTNVLTVGTGTFVAGEVSEDAVTASVALPASGHTELEFVLRLAAPATDDDTFDLRLTRADGTALDTYTVTPRITAVAAPGGGTAHEQPAADTATLADAAARAVELGRADTAAALDAAARDLERALGDSAGAADSVGRALELTVGDSAGAADATTRDLAFEHTVTPTDAVGAADTSSRAVELGRADAAAAGDALARDLTRPFADTTPTADTSSRAVELGRADSASTADAYTRAVELGRADAAAAGDALARAVELTRSDLATLADSAGRALERALADTAAAGDALARAVELGRADTAAAGDTLTRDLELGRADTAAALDAAARDLERALADSIAVADFATDEQAGTALELNLDDTAAAADSATRATGLEVADTAAAADAAARDLERALADTAAALDAAARDLEAALADSAGTADATTRELAGVALELNLDDTAGVADSAGAAPALALADVLALADELARDSARIIADELALADAYTTTIPERGIGFVAATVPGVVTPSSAGSGGTGGSGGVGLVGPGYVVPTSPGRVLGAP